MDLYSGVVVVLHLNNQLEIIEQQKHLTAHYMPGQMSGALLVLHQQNQIPVLIKDGISLPSGYFMSTKLRFVRHKRLASPYGSCASPDDMDTDYQQMTCYADCLQELVFKKCGCIDYTSYNEGLDLLAEAGFSACLSVKQDKERLLENWMCRKRTHVNYTTHCLFKCPPLCEELLYHYDVSSRLRFLPMISQNACHSSQMNLIYETILGTTEKLSVLFAVMLYATPCILDRGIEAKAARIRQNKF